MYDYCEVCKKESEFLKICKTCLNKKLDLFDEMLECLIDSYKRFIEYEIDVDIDPPQFHKNAMNNYKNTIEKATNKKINEVINK